MVLLPDGEKFRIYIYCFSTESTNVTDRQTDTQTDRHRMTAQAVLAYHHTINVMRVKIWWFWSVVKYERNIKNRKISPQTNTAIIINYFSSYFPLSLHLYVLQKSRWRQSLLYWLVLLPWFPAELGGYSQTRLWRKLQTSCHRLVAGRRTSTNKETVNTELVDALG